jgi:thymidylate synthase (FAD)
MEEIAGIKYSRPTVYLLADNGIGQSEFAARTCYDSFEQSENEGVKIVNQNLENLADCDRQGLLYDVNDSKLLEDLSFVHFHHSVIEHSVVTFFIKGTSRGVLQELARHRIASYSVKSTRYTLDELMYNFIVSYYIENNQETFIKRSLALDLFVTMDEEYNKIELEGIYSKLSLQAGLIGMDEMLALIIPKANIDAFKDSMKAEEAFAVLKSKKKRNVGDKFKHVITDNFKTDLTMTVNLRSLRNFFDLRLSGAAWFQIQWLSQEMKKETPEKYLKLIFKKFKKESED